MRRNVPDRILLGIIVTLVCVGFLIFSSASLGLLPRAGAQFSSVAINQIVFGIIGGSFALFITSSVHYRFWRKWAFYFFLAALFLTILVFVPGIGFAHAGAARWISIGGFTLQPAEILKIGFIIYVATWLSGTHRHITSSLKGTLPFLGIVGIVGIIMLLQPDTDTFAVMLVAALAMFVTAGGRIRDVAIMFFLGVLLVATLAFTRPYVMDRIVTFVNPANDPLGAGYQVNQSLIAIGSGNLFGRGFGQSVQKFEYLPEPIGDSIFAVYGEEFGFIGTSLLVLLFVAFAFRGYRIASHATDLFGMLLVVGFVSVLITQAFLNIAAMLGLAPLGGLPLPFISHGGTALLAALAMIGIILNVSKHQKKRAVS